MLQIADKARKEGHEAITFSTNQFQLKYSKLPLAPAGHFYYGSYFENAIHYVLARQTGYNGCFSYFSTVRLIRKLKKFKPDILHLHNLHGFCINLPLIFKYIKKHNIKTVWTLHDCWAFTGHCPHFDMIGCEKWREGCSQCPQYGAYPKSKRDTSKAMWKLKRKWFGGVSQMYLVTPSEWLSRLTKQSFMNSYPVKVINNGIDLSVFKPSSSNFRIKHNCENKHVVLGVSFGWSDRKGIDVFIELSQKLDDNYRIVLVGTDESIEKSLPDNIITIRKTQNQQELAEIYSACDVLFNPTREENFPTVNMEALACGTPVVSFNTGGCAEIADETCGSTVSKNDIDAAMREIVRICEENPYLESDCLKRAKAFDNGKCFKKYIELYEELTSDGASES